MEWLEAQKGKPDATDEFVKKINKRHQQAQSVYKATKNVARFVKKADAMLPPVASEDEENSSVEEVKQKAIKSKPKKKGGKAKGSKYE